MVSGLGGGDLQGLIGGVLGTLTDTSYPMRFLQHLPNPVHDIQAH
jgi:hypothetical protein